MSAAVELVLALTQKLVVNAFVNTHGLEAFDFCCWCAGCDDCCCLLWCGPCALDQLARQEYLASNGYSVEYDFYAATGVVPGVQYAQPPV